GDAPAARLAYAKFLALWEHADPGLQELQDARARAAAGASKDSAREAAAPQRHQFVVELDPKAEVRPGTTGGVRVVESFSAADKTYAIYEAQSADALAKHLERAALSARRVIQVKDINSPARGGGRPAGDEPRQGQQTFG